MRVLFSGGGTGGSVTPLLAIYHELKKKGRISALWLGTKRGPERRLVEAAGISFKRIPAGKWRRYFSLNNIIDPFRIALGFLRALQQVRAFKPDAVLTAGSFIAVPVVWAARLHGVPVFVHQQDVRIGLANKLMARHARTITVTFPEHLKLFPKEKTIWTGNPFRSDLLKGFKEKAQMTFSLKQGVPTVLILGGGTGARQINELVAASIEDLLSCAQVIHLAGLGFKTDEAIARVAGMQLKYPHRYHVFEFLVEEMAHALAIADVVVARAGMGTLTELALLGKPALLIPLAGHQEENARYFISKNAALGFGQKEVTSRLFAKTICELVGDTEKQTRLSQRIRDIMKEDAAQTIARRVREAVK